MNVFVYLLFGAVMYIGVVKGHPDRSQNNEYDEMAIGMMVAACVFAVVDSGLTLLDLVSTL